jgi:hypothetical protein
VFVANFTLFVDVAVVTLFTYSQVSTFVNYIHVVLIADFTKEPASFSGCEILLLSKIFVLALADLVEFVAIPHYYGFEWSINREIGECPNCQDQDHLFKGNFVNFIVPKTCHFFNCKAIV